VREEARGRWAKLSSGHSNGPFTLALLCGLFSGMDFGGSSSFLLFRGSSGFFLPCITGRNIGHRETPRHHPASEQVTRCQRKPGPKIALMIPNKRKNDRSWTQLLLLS